MGTILKQYEELKAKHPDALLLFRIGDFYEAYNEDAVEVSEILGITLTKSKDKQLAGFPFRALDIYLPKLIRAGKRVAICDQLEDPKKTQKQFGVIEDVKHNKKETNMENKTNEQQELIVAKNKIKGIATETIKALKGELPSTLADYLYEAVGKLEVIKIKHSLNLVPNRTEIAFLIEQAEINNGK